MVLLIRVACIDDLLEILLMFLLEERHARIST